MRPPRELCELVHGGAVQSGGGQVRGDAEGGDQLEDGDVVELRKEDDDSAEGDLVAGGICLAPMEPHAAEGGGRGQGEAVTGR